MAAGSALAGRMKRLKEAMRKERLQGAVLVPGPNLKYLTGVDSLMLERTAASDDRTNKEPDVARVLGDAPLGVGPPASAVWEVLHHFIAGSY